LTIGKSIILVGENPTTTILDGNGTCPIIEIAANEVTIKNFTVENSGEGPWGAIHITRSSSCVITSNIIENSHYGILLFQSNKTEVSFNTVKNSNFSIFLDFSSHNRIFQNSVFGGIKGIRTGANSVNNTVEGNQVESCDNAIALGSQANYDFFFGNHLNKNTVGVLFEGPVSKNCTFLGNFLVENDRAIEIYPTAVNNTFIYNSFLLNDMNVNSFWDSDNRWDYGYLFGGNFWSDNIGEDRFNGPYQNETGSDGIGDAPYTVYSNYTDAYPLLGNFVRVTDLTVQNGALQFIGYSTNSSLEEFNFDGQQMLLNITTLDVGEDFGFCRAAIPKSFANDSLETLIVLVNGQRISYNLTESPTYFFLYFTYAHKVVSENPSPIADVYIFGFMIGIIAFFLIVFRIRRTTNTGEPIENPEEDDSAGQD